MNTRLDTLDWWFGERSEAKLVILGFNSRGCIQPNQLRVVTVSARLIAWYVPEGGVSSAAEALRVTRRVSMIVAVQVVRAMVVVLRSG